MLAAKAPTTRARAASPVGTVVIASDKAPTPAGSNPAPRKSGSSVASFDAGRVSYRRRLGCVVNIVCADSSAES